MPHRPFSREKEWLFPPPLGELIPDDHPVRYVAAFVDRLSREDWGELGVAPDGAVQGAPGCHPRVLLGVWLYGFMDGVRSSRKLERACRDQVPYLWLTGWQRPDHHTLWRFYQGHRQAMRTLDGDELAGLLERTRIAIEELEAQNVGGDDPPQPRLPTELAQLQALQERVVQALARVTHEEGQERANVTDPDATLQKARGGGFLVGYNARAVVAGVAAPPEPTGAAPVPGGLLITAAEVTTDRDDHDQLLPLLEQAETVTPLVQVLTDGGYHSAANLAACADHTPPIAIVMPDPQAPRPSQPYHKAHFVYDPQTDTYTCPQGQTLTFQGLDRRQAGGPPVRRYRAAKTACDACPVRAACTSSTRKGRSVTRGPDEARLQAHRALMATDDAKTAYRRRKTLPEPVFGILKEQQAARRFLLRGLANVRAEWSLLATAFNLRTLARIWRSTSRPASQLAAA